MCDRIWKKFVVKCANITGKIPRNIAVGRDTIMESIGELCKRFFDANLNQANVFSTETAIARTIVRKTWRFIRILKHQ
jgi:hypothetical protein